MTSTPSYPSRAAISNAVAVDSGYTEAVDSATFTPDTPPVRFLGSTGSATGASVRPAPAGTDDSGTAAGHRGRPTACGLDHTAVRVARQTTGGRGSRGVRCHHVELAKDHTLPQRPRAD